MRKATRGSSDDGFHYCNPLRMVDMKRGLIAAEETQLWQGMRAGDVTRWRHLPPSHASGTAAALHIGIRVEIMP